MEIESESIVGNVYSKQCIDVRFGQVYILKGLRTLSCSHCLNSVLIAGP